MKYVLDTNILLFYIRKNQLARWIDQQYAPLSEENDAILCVVSNGELASIALQNDWSDAKKKTIREFTDKLITVDLNDELLTQRYAEIDAYSQGKLKSRKSPFTARNMGKNDLWIAAIASASGATLLTSDKDFDHLHNVFLTVIWIDPKTNNDKK
jgi:tRNA(fMet)-specific endonuclease VapC